MIQIFKNPSYDIVSNQRNALIGSSILVLIGVIMLFVQGVNLGIDFTGGAQARLQFENPVTSNEVRTASTGTDFADAEIKTAGENGIVMILKTTEDFDEDELASEIRNTIAPKITNNQLTDLSLDQISGKMSNEMIERSMEALEFALVLIALYIIVRFSSRHTLLGIAGFLIDYALFKFLWMDVTGVFIPLFVLYPIIFKAGFSFGALAAVFHDIVITVSLLEIFNIEFSMLVIAGLLTIIGYSLNDTIVVFDRIRENLSDTDPREFNHDDFLTTVNKSINNTLNRTVITSLTTFFVVFVLSIFGGASIFAFGLTLCIGVIVGTFSSVFIAAPIMMSRYEAEMEEVRIKLEQEEAEGSSVKNKDGIVV